MRILYINQDVGIDWCSCAGGATHIRSVIRALLRAGHSVALLVRNTSKLAAPTAPLELPCYVDPGLVPWAEFDVVYERYSLWGALSLSIDLPWCLEVNSPLIEEQMRFRTQIDVSRAATIRDAVFRRVQRIVLVSESLKSYVPLDALPKTVVVPNGIDSTLFSPMALPTRFAFGYVGSMRPWHDLSTCLQAFLELAESFPDVDCHIAGGGPLGEVYQESFRHPRIVFHGLVPHETVPRFLGTISCGLAPFIEDTPTYFSPLKIREYLAAHRTVITHPAFADFDGVTVGVTGVESTRAAMEEQIRMDRTRLRFPVIPEWETTLLLP